MFLCEPCHDRAKERLPIRRDGLFESYGSCESCSKTASCVDCHCTSREIEEAVAKVSEVFPGG